MDAVKINTDFDKDFKKIEHYQKLPQMMPWIGQKYGKKYSKVIFVAESHYFPTGSTIHLDKLNWYNIIKDQLNSDEISYTNTREALLKRYKRNTIWKNPASIMKKIGITSESDNIYENFAYYNFFQRPAEKEGKGIDINAKDREVANSVFEKILEILQPEIVIFLSVKAWNNCSKNTLTDNIIIDFVPHPARPWWNKKSKRYAFKEDILLSGAEKFKKIAECYVNKK